MPEMSEEYFKKIMTTVVLIVLVVLTFFILKPILLSIILGLILAFVFMPVYNWLYAKTKSKNLSAGLICLLLAVIIVLPFWFLTPIIVDQSFKIFMASQQIDLITPMQKFLPAFSEEFLNEMSSILYSFINKITNSLMNSLADLILNFPTLFLQFLVVAFTFFFVLRDKDVLVEYIKSLLPFSADVERRLFSYSKGITSSVIYGQIIVGIIQGLVVAIGFFIFGISNALFLSLLAVIAGVFPIIGTTIVWLPVAIYLIVAGNTLAAIGILIFGLISSTLDNFLRPIIVSRRTQMHSSLILIGMIGGLFLFGVLGLILGPLIIAYLLIILELYRNRKSPQLFRPEKI